MIRDLDQIWSAFPTIMMSYFVQICCGSLGEGETRGLEERGAILAALEQDDGTSAEQLMTEHIENNRRELLAALSE